MMMRAFMYACCLSQCQIIHVPQVGYIRLSILAIDKASQQLGLAVHAVASLLTALEYGLFFMDSH